MNIASTSSAPTIVAPSTDTVTGDPSTGSASAQPGSFGHALSQSLRGNATAGRPVGFRPEVEPRVPDSSAGAPASRDAEGRGIAATTSADPAAAALRPDAVANDAKALEPGPAADPGRATGAEIPAGSGHDPLAAARAIATAGARAATDDATAVDARSLDVAKGTADIGASPKADTKTEAKATDDQPDATATDLAAQIALVSQWAALAQPGATAAGDAKTVTAARSDVSGKLDIVRGKLDTVRGADDRATARTIDAGALQDAAAGLNGASAALALERATHGLAAPSGATKTGDPVADATADAKTPSMDKLVALAVNVAHRTSEPTTLANLAQQVATQAAAGVTTFAPPTVDVASAANQTAANGVTALHEQVGTAAWSHEVGQAVLRMAADNVQNVSLRLHPEQLGPLDVQMRIDNGVAHLQFAAAHVETRQALEASKSTLDNLFSQQGMKLGEWSVGQQSSGSTFAQNFGAHTGTGSGTSATRGGNDADDPTDVTTITVRTQRTPGLVDTFA